MKTIAFIIPVFNEEKRLRKTFKALHELKLPRGLRLEEVIFVNDGSSDRTEGVIEKNAVKLPFSIKLLTYDKNRGKGHAVRQGMLHSQADYALLFDADMSTPLSELAKFMPHIKRGVDVIIGTRKNGKSTVIKHQPFIREQLGRGFTRLTQMMLNITVTDFTCGFKAFSRRATQLLFSQSAIDGWGYDAEIIFLTIKHDLSLQQVPVLWSNDERTRVKLYYDIPRTLVDLTHIVLRHRLLASLPFIVVAQAEPSTL